MSYNNSLKTHYVDPVSFVPNGRCAFQLDSVDIGYMSNMRLLNVGVQTDAETFYNRGLGAMSIIKNIRLLDGRTELSSLNNVSPYLFFKNCNRTNATNVSGDAYFKRSQLGLNISQYDDKSFRTENSGKANVGGPDLPIADAPTNVAYLDLRECFPLLLKFPMGVIPSSIFPNLRIEIEFFSRPSDQILIDTGRTIQVVRPILAVDTTSNPNMVEAAIKEMTETPIMWESILHDNYRIPASSKLVADIGATEEIVQTSNNFSLAYKGKFIERLLVLKQLADPALLVSAGGAVSGFGGASSQANLGQTIQYKLNGRSVFPGFNGVTGANEMAGILSDEYGSVSTSILGNQYQPTSFPTVNSDAGAKSQQSFDCVRLGARVAELQIQIGRVNNNDTSALSPTNQAMNINLYAETLKVLSVSQGRYRIAFV